MAPRVARLDRERELDREDIRRISRDQERASADDSQNRPIVNVNVERSGSLVDIESPRAVEEKEKSRRRTVTTERVAWATTAILVMVVAALLGRYSGRPISVPEPPVQHEGKR
jgi:hypothetical protein